MKSKYSIKHLIHHEHNTASFSFWLLGVLEYFSVSAQINDNAQDKVNISQSAATKQDILYIAVNDIFFLRLMKPSCGMYIPVPCLKI